MAVRNLYLAVCHVPDHSRRAVGVYTGVGLCVRTVRNPGGVVGSRLRGDSIMAADVNSCV